MIALVISFYKIQKRYIKFAESLRKQSKRDETYVYALKFNKYQELDNRIE